MFGASCKPLAIADCDEIHSHGFPTIAGPDGPIACMCGKCNRTADATEFIISHSKAKKPVEPESLIGSDETDLGKLEKDPSASQRRVEYLRARIAQRRTLINTPKEKIQQINPMGLKGGIG